MGYKPQIEPTTTVTLEDVGITIPTSVLSESIRHEIAVYDAYREEMQTALYELGKLDDAIERKRVTILTSVAEFLKKPPDA